MYSKPNCSVGLLINLLLVMSLVLVACGAPPPEIPDTQAESDAPAAADAAAEAPAVVEVPESQYSESPMLTAQVAAGDLPPVDERLPLEPLVIPVEESIGVYGGSYSTWDTQFDTGSCKEHNMRNQQMIWRNPRTTEFEPNVLTNWSYSEDYQELTIEIRPGLKWSDW